MVQKEVYKKKCGGIQEEQDIKCEKGRDRRPGKKIGGTGGSGKKNRRNQHRNRKLRKCAILSGWLAVWFCLAAAVDNEILLADPFKVAEAFLAMLGKGGFYLTVGRSLLRIALGFWTGFGAAVILAAAGRRFPLLEEALSPVMGLAKTVPVASFAVLLLIWWGSSFLATAICFLVVLPNLYISTLEGLKSTNKPLLEMARVFRLSFRDRFFYIYRPALKPFLYGSLKVSLGMCWKSGVAAEVIGIPEHSIGGELYLSKVTLDTAGVLAWTMAVVLLSFLFERAVLGLAGLFFAWEPPCRGQSARGTAPRGGADGKKSEADKRGREEADPIGLRRLELASVTKCYDGKKVLDGINAVYEPGSVYYLTSPSGSGKTTLLHVLAGLVEPEAGRVSVPCACSMVFQEDRLCEDYSAVKNVELVTGSRPKAEKALSRLLEKEALEKPCRLLSGGMKRRVVLVRALEADSDYVLLDEPFTGMDVRTRRQAEKYIRERQDGRPLIIATHGQEMSHVFSPDISLAEEPCRTSSFRKEDRIPFKS